MIKFFNVTNKIIFNHIVTKVEFEMDEIAEGIC